MVFNKLLFSTELKRVFNHNKTIILLLIFFKDLGSMVDCIPSSNLETQCSDHYSKKNRKVRREQSLKFPTGLKNAEFPLPQNYPSVCHQMRIVNALVLCWAMIDRFTIRFGTYNSSDNRNRYFPFEYVLLSLYCINIVTVIE